MRGCMYMIKTYNPHEPVKEIVAILHKYKIPIAAVNQVFELVQEDIQKETVPYNPKERLIREVAISETIESATCPKE